jgi:dUTP pyrophosphatase
MKIKFKRLCPEAQMPKKAHDTDACFDLVATSINFINELDKEYHEYETGLAVNIPFGYVGLIFPRSSISKTRYVLSNSVGVIDPGFLGEIKFRFKELEFHSDYYHIGDRIGQLMIIPIPEIEFEETSDLGISDRNTGGFGSTGK